MTALGYIGAMPFAEYLALDGKNFSTLKHALVSGAHYQAARTRPSKDSAAYVVGRVSHSALLEPDTLEARYHVPTAAEWNADSLHRGKKAGKEAWTAWLLLHPECADIDADEYKRRRIVEAHPGCEIVTAEELETAKAIRDAAWSHPDASALLTGARPEQVAQWLDEGSGFVCKMRADALNGSALLDVKTIESLARLRWHVREYHYLMQSAFYGDGLRACGLDIKAHFILAIEKAPPYDVGVFRVGDNEIAQGREQYREALDTVRACEDAGKWPGAYPGVTEIAAVLYPDESGYEVVS